MYNTEQQAKDFKKQFEEVTNTIWACDNSKKLKGCIFSVLYSCKFSGKRQKPCEEKLRHVKRTAQRNTGCPARLRILIKDLTPENLEKDALLPDYPMEVTLIGDHNHDIDFIGPCNEFKPTSETEERFHNFYLENLTPGQAIKRQIKHLLLCGENPEQIQDSRYLMSHRMASYRWKKENKKAHGYDWTTALKRIESLDRSGS